MEFENFMNVQREMQRSTEPTVRSTVHLIALVAATAVAVAAIVLMDLGQYISLAGDGFGLVIRLIVAALLLTPLLYLGVARLRESAGNGRQPSILSSRQTDVSAHRRIRIAMYAALLVAGGHAAFLAWQAEKLQTARALDAEVADLAGTQRMLSQRIARLSMLVGTGGTSTYKYREELRAALDRAASDALRLEEKLREAAPSSTDKVLLDEALSDWATAHQRLRTRADSLLKSVDSSGAKADLGTLASQVEASADPALAAAQRLVDEIENSARVRHGGKAGAATAWVALTILLLAFMAIVVAEPTARSAKSQYLKLVRQARELKRLALVAKLTTNAVLITDAQQKVVWVNDAFCRMTGYSLTDAIGQRPSCLLQSKRTDVADATRIRAATDSGQGVRCQILATRKDGGDLWLDLDIQPLRDEDDAFIGFVDVATDITQYRKAQIELRLAEKQADETIHHLAFYDPLTELPNRRLMQDRLAQAMAASERHSRYGAVLFIDLDHFKHLNDIKGHQIGDQLLVEVAKRLQESVRVSDTVARQGGDEFVVILADLTEQSEEAAVQAGNIAEAIRTAINQPFLLEEHQYNGTPSIGVCLFSGCEKTVDELLKRADTAMYEAKKSGRNAVRFFDPAAHAAMKARIALESDLRHALPGEQLRLHYQMQVDRTGRALGAEVLLRWMHPQRGLIPPGQFIPLAEETGLIVPIGRWVLEQACAQLRTWAQGPDRRQLQLAVNVSARQFRQPDFVEQIQVMLQKHGVEPSRLKLELTESLVLVNVTDTVAKMQAIKQMGVRFSIDDFGTGQSSLAYLTKLPLDQLKIDQSFVRNMSVSHTDAVVVQTIIGMANSLGLEVIAEGVETEEQRFLLDSFGCSNYQGHLFGKPAPLAEFEEALQASGLGTTATGAYDHA